MKILVINVGSTSLKFKLYAMPEERVQANGRIEGIGQPKSEFRYSSDGQADTTGQACFTGYEDATEHMLAYLQSAECKAIRTLDEVDAIGFKTVLAKNIVDAVFLDENVLQAMEEMSFVAPSHNPPYISAIRGFRQRLPGVPLIGLFEPAFHKTIPEYAWQYAMPAEYAEKFGIRRYGFHGASHRYAAERAAQLTGNNSLRLISCHLGGSSSVNATAGLRSLDNSFGFSPQSGLIQSNRPGDVDVIVPLYMMESLGMSIGEVRHVLTAESGLKGMSGISGEMKDILRASDEGNSRAALTLDAFVYQVRKWIGSAAVILGGIDAIVFTGGIGERSAYLRSRCCVNLEFLGVSLDEEKNTGLSPDSDIASSKSIARILIIEANEELIVARSCVEKLAL
jgi:acetate kinase